MTAPTSSTTLTVRDRALVRWDGRQWTAYVVLDRAYEGFAHTGANAHDALNNATQDAALKRELGQLRPEIPTPAEFAAQTEGA